jgi:hypothetical protein
MAAVKQVLDLRQLKPGTEMGDRNTYVICVKFGLQVSNYKPGDSSKFTSYNR